MGHEGPSSLLQLLRAQGLANALSSGAAYEASDTASLEVRP
jgi:secreted Zn-dependent insulinase-like peptidase